MFGNGYAGLKLRLWFYSIFSKFNLHELKQKYGKMYEELSREEFCSVYSSVLVKLLLKDIDIVVVTKNVYAKNLLNGLTEFISKGKRKVKLVTLNENKHNKFREIIDTSSGQATIIGNNLSDDILNSFRVGLPYIYVGRSTFVNFIINVTNKLFKKNGIQIDNFRKIMNIYY